MSENNDLNFSTVRTVPLKTASDIRLLVLDLDGTIVDRSNHIRDSVAPAVDLVKRRGVAVAIATGRRYQSSLHAYDLIGSTLPLICYEGGLIRDRNSGITHRHWPLEPHVVSQILDQTEHLSLDGRLSVHFYIEDDLCVSNLNEASSKFLEGSTVVPIVVSDLRSLLNRATTKVMVLSHDVEIINQLSTHLQNSDTRSRIREYKSITLLEAFHPTGNKRSAVKYLAEEIMALQPKNVMAIGDDFSDIEMLEYAGIGVAMGNAPAAVKSFADWVTTTIEKDGVARAIERWILPNQRSQKDS
ncbi:MAG TPA: HAD family hydrolase [Pyrinomonadaceae bacterium]|nr:HAD family hydrolase [Pyrinomonadaceae bacterium]